MPTIELKSARCQARISLQGAQMLDASLDGQPLLWLSPLADFTPGKAIRGGIPICFPWFGKHPAGLPAHGFARNQPWTLLDQTPNTARLALDDSDATLAMWPHRFHAELQVSLADDIALSFTVENRDADPIHFSYALHSYFAVADCLQCEVAGLDGRLRREVGHVTSPHRGNVVLAEPVDAIFEQAPAALTLMDGSRRIGVAADHMRSAVVWNPGDAALGIPDIGSHWPEYVCVERGNIGSAALTLAPGDVHAASLRLTLAGG
jgi:D-hexose-6-phosphate mutarotase